MGKKPSELYRDSKHVLENKDEHHPADVVSAGRYILTYDSILEELLTSRSDQFRERLEERKSRLESQMNDPIVFNQAAIDYKLQILNEIMNAYNEVHK